MRSRPVELLGRLAAGASAATQNQSVSPSVKQSVCPSDEDARGLRVRRRVGASLEHFWIGCLGILRRFELSDSQSVSQSVS